MSEFLDNDDKKILRSIINKYFPVDLLIKLDMITRAHDIDNNSKTPEVHALLNEYNVPYTSLGNGTNRYGILVDGYAVKIALDRMGKIDNQREFKYAQTLYPNVVKVYECSAHGLVAVFEYITIFSLDDYYDNQAKMREILDGITRNYLVGDIGISQINYVNWGTRSDGSIAILDFAYIYSLSYKGFMCTCEDEGTLEYDNDYNYLICPFCRKKWSFADVRKRITRQDEINEIGDIMEIGYVLHKPEELHKIDYKKSPMLKPKEKKKKKPENTVKKKHKQDWNFDDPEIQRNMLRELNESIRKNK